MSRTPRTPRAHANRSYAATLAGPFAFAQAHGFTPGSWRKRADGVTEMQVTNAWGTPLQAWYRDTPREELFVLEASKDMPPAWAERGARRNPDAPKKIDPLAFIAADPEAAIMATLTPEQLWSQSSGAGNAWAMWELQRREQGTPWVRTNPRATFGARLGHRDEDGYWYQGYVEIDGKRRYLRTYSSDKASAMSDAKREAQRVDVAKGFATFKPGTGGRQARHNPNQGMDVLMAMGEDGPPMGGDWAQWAQSREGIMHRNPRQVTGPDACSRCDGTGYAGPHGDTCSRCEGSGVDARERCEGGCGKMVRESQGMCRPCSDAEDEERGVVRDAFGYPMQSLGGGQYRTIMGKIVRVQKNPRRS